ncbi:MAG: MFS transporter [Paracoccaceae bacterium]
MRLRDIGVECYGIRQSFGLNRRMARVYKDSLIFNNRDFGLYFAGMTIVTFASQIEAVTIGWQVYQLGRATGSIKEAALLVGMVGLVQFVPMFALTLFAGSLADRMSRRALVLGAIATETIGVIGLLLAALQPHPSTPVIFAIAALFGASRAFFRPAAWALMPMLVPTDQVARAISLSSLGGEIAVITGPWIGGLLIAWATPAAYAAVVVLYAISLVFMLSIRRNTTPERQPGSQIALIREGLVYVWQNKIIFGAISLDLFAVLLGGATALLPAFASDILQVGPTGFGLLRSGPAIGAALMALALSRWPLKRQAGVRMFWAVAAFGLATVVFGLSKSLPLSIAALAVLGAADMVSVYVRQTLMQIVTPDHMRGRVSSVSGLFISGSNELGEFESGVVSRFVGPVAAAVLGGIGTLIVTGIWAWKFPDLRKADRLDGQDQPMESEPRPAI